MKWMVASDIHGSAYYCEKLLEAYRVSGAEKLVILGDILYHGPRNELPKDYAPKKVIAMLNEVADELLCVRGNCEAEVDQMVLEFPVMAEYAVFYIGTTMYFATHGHKFNKENPPCLKEGDVLLHGHTHVVADEICTAKGPKGEYVYRYINPGSVSIPKENTGHGYVILTENGVEFKTLE
ncbi:MAG: phosphodiesterase [Lachnospiraceae bacterium]|nr:phosphodiesterase [Lachnospiraceae bacterium]